MRTLPFLLGGCALKGTMVGVGALWFAINAANLSVGVNRAGYAVREELPIFLLILLVPVAVTAPLRWRFP